MNKKNYKLKIFLTSLGFILLSVSVIKAIKLRKNPKPDIEIVHLNLANESDRQKIEDIHIAPELALKNYQLVKDIRDVFDHNKIDDYWITYGTLLGAIRHGGIIPWDDDLDLCLNIKHEQQLLSLKETFNQLGYELTPFPKFGYKIVAKESITLPSGDVIRPFADIFIMELKGDHYIQSSPKARKRWPNSFFLKEQVDTKQMYKFGEFEIKGPSKLWAGTSPTAPESLDKNNPLNFFTRVYSTNWKTHAVYDRAHFTKIQTRYLFELDPNPKPALPTGPIEDRYPQKG